MSGFIIAQIQIKWGNANLVKFTETMNALIRLFADEEVQIHDSFLTQYGGTLYEIINIWAVEDAEHMSRARLGLRQKEEYHHIHAVLTEVVESEQLRYVQKIAYANA